MTFVIQREKTVKRSLLEDSAQLTFTCPKEHQEIGTLEKGVKYVQS